MTRVLIPFRAEHILQVAGGHFEEWRWALERESGPSFTGVVDDKIIGCAGVYIMWRGVGFAWAIFDPSISKHGLWVTRIVKHVLYDTIRIYKLHRVEAIVRMNDVGAARWAEALGLHVEHSHHGIARKYLPNGENVIRYELVN